MSQYPSYELQRETYLEWREYLLHFPWEWLATLTLEDGMQYFPALHKFKKWRHRLIKREKIRVGAYLFSAYRRGHIHFHVLMLGQNRFGKTLLDCSPKYWESEWKKCVRRIEPVTNLYGACDYVALHFMGFKSDFTDVESFDKTLLRQAMHRHCGFIDNFDGLRCLEDSD